MLLGSKINHSALATALVIVAVLNSGCQSIDPAVDIPSYITIDAIDLQSDYATEGTDDHKITDVWILAGSEDLGAYELPATIPILMEGTQDIRISGGIKINGSSSIRFPYAFFEPTTLSVKLVPGATVKLEPQVSYYSGLTFAWLEDFEVGSTIESLLLSDTSLTLENSSHPAMGAKSAVIRVDATNDFYLGSTNGQNFVLPQGLPVYLELNYSSNVEFSIGAIKHTIAGSTELPVFITLFPSGDWNKIYLELTNYVSSETDATSFEIYFSCLHDPTVANNVVYLDNIKLIYR